MIYKYVPRPFKKHYKKFFWRFFYNYIGTFGLMRRAKFLNHGYASEGTKKEEFTLRTLNTLNKNLYLHLMKHAEIDGKNYMEIGCGRGAGLALLTEHYKPSRCVGVDLSDANIRFGKKLCKGLKVEFKRGDAEKQIFPDNSFDVVLNLESSHCYASKINFYKNVYSILKNGGRFLYSDLFWGDYLIEEMEKQFTQTGFVTEKKENITKPVFRSIEIQADVRNYYVQGSMTPQKYLGNFVAVQGSELHEGIKTEAIKYMFYVLRKP